MKIVIKKHDNERDYIIIFWLWFVFSLISMTNLYKVLGNGILVFNRMVDYIALVVLVFLIVFTHTYKTGEIVKIAIVGSCILISTICSGNNALMSTLIFVVAAKDVDIDKIIKMVYKTLIVFLLIISVMSLLGIIPSTVGYRINGMMRTSLGFYHPNTLGMLIFELFVCFYMLHRTQMKWWGYFVGIAGIVFVWYVPNSQTGCVALALFMLLIIIKDIFEKGEKQRWRVLFGDILIVGAIFVNLFSVFFTIFDIYKYKELSLLDVLLTYRFYYAHAVFGYYGVTLFGQRAEFNSVYNQYGLRLICDNSYTHLLIVYGIIGYVVFTGIYILAMIGLRKQERYSYLVIFFVYAVYGIMESNLYTIRINIFLLVISQFLFPQNPLINRLADSVRSLINNPNKNISKGEA